MIDVNKIIKIEGIYKCKNVYSVEFIIERAGMGFRIAYPYSLKSTAQQAVNAMKTKQQQNIPVPNDKPYIWFVGRVSER